jgi:lysozyme
MTVNDDNIEIMKKYIQEHEGLRLKVYKDSLGKLTVGFGHLILPGEKYDTITLEKANEIFEDDFKNHYEQAEQFPGFDKLPFSKKCVIVDMVFNLGKFYLSWPRFTGFMQAGDYVSASNEIKTSKYYRQVGRRAKNNIYLLLK